MIPEAGSLAPAGDLGARRRLATATALAALSGLLQVLTFPRFSLYFLSAVCVTPLLLAVSYAATRKQRFLFGWLAGTIFWGGCCYWVYGVMHDYAYLAAPAAGAIFAAFAIVKGLHLGVFALAAGPLLRKGWAIPAVAALWTAIEGTHQYLGFTWLLLGNAAAGMSMVAPLAPYAGVYGPSFVLMMLNVAAALVILRRPRYELGWLLPLPLLVILPGLPAGEKGNHTVRLVQPAVRPDEVINGWTSAKNDQHLRKMLAMSTGATSGPLEHIDLLVWPEYSVPAFYFDSPQWQTFMASVAQAVDAPFIFNSIAYKQVDGERRPMNTAVVLDAEGRFVATYAKMFLVPFGEFVPWPFSLFINKITLAAGDFYPGDEVTVAEVGGHKIGTYICYENVFARGVRRFVANGAEVLVNISNDAWYGPTAARYQHLLIARMRAIENSRWILRATSDGVTTAINRAGQISPPLPQFEPGVLTTTYAYADELTWFARFGQWFWWLCCAAAAGGLFLANRER